MADPTPSDLRRGKTLQVSLHWLTATTKAVSTLDDTAALISYHLGHDPEFRPHGQMGYTQTFEWTGGLKLLYNDKRLEMGLCLVADGNACEYHGLETLALIYQALGLKATRIDLAVDGCRFTPSALHKLWLEDKVRTQARPMKNAKPGRRRHRAHRWHASPTGDTLYMGSPESTQSARCYNYRGFTRFEMVFKQERAAQVMQALCERAELAPTLGAVISQFVAFVKLDDANRSRCTLLPFWAQFMERLGRNEVVTRLEARPALTRERLRCWMKHTVSPSLAAYAEMESEFESSDVVLGELLQEGRKRMRPKHHALVAACMGERPDAGDTLPEIVRHAPPQVLEAGKPAEEEAA